ncbi:MAG: hypothetical protein D6813_10010 [Calditrichaeota bacterium]|nr:MAG: hypothetical protein D6813_10010 [Calditrichota bacterium]
MHYPWWYVPFLTAPMLIAVVATLHIWVALYAVGGGIFLAYETGFAHRTQNHKFLDYLKSHTRFFILITVVYGAITGIGIWWTIGLTSPLATQSLIHIFIFGWAMEYVFFILEIVSAFIFLYFWDRLDSKTHTIVGWIYGFSAWMSLVLITGITSFQLNSGGWSPGDGFWPAFFNPQTLPQIVARTGGALLLAALYIYLHASFKLKEDRDMMAFLARRSAKWVMWGAVLILIGGGLWYLNLPERSKAALEGASALNIMMVLVTVGTVLMFFMTYFGPYKNPQWLTQGFAIVLFLGGLAHVTEGEFIREAVRKPYIVDNLVLGNQIFKQQIPELKTHGYLNGGVWTRFYTSKVAPSAIDSTGKITTESLGKLTEIQQLELGKTLFMYHCNDCHAVKRGVSAIQAITRGWTDEMVKIAIEEMDKIHYFMPPWSGTKKEAEILAKYINSLKLPSPNSDITRSESW